MNNSSSLSSESDTSGSDDSDFIEHLDIEEFKEECNEFTEKEDAEPSSTWKEIQDPPYFNKIPILQPKSTFNTQNIKSPFELFETIIGCDLWPLLVDNTNEYASKTLGSENMAYYLERHPESRLHRWTLTGTFEIMKFIGLILSMALEKRENIKDHWKSSPCFPSYFEKVMSLRRFQLLDRFFQINAIKSDTNYAMDKVLPLLQIFQNFNKIYTPSSKLCIDEIVAPFSGRFRHLTYNPQKPDKWGIKVFGIADSINGYCMSLIPSFGKNTYRSFGVENLDGLILDLVRKFGCPGASLYIDNYYCHFNLAETLLSEGLNVTGTFRQSRKDVPDIIKDAVVKKLVVSSKKTQETSKTKKNTALTRTDLRYFESVSGIYAIKWKSKREITLLTTNHSLEFETRQSARNREVKRPIVVHEYNNFMRGIDRLNQRVHYIR